MRQPKTTQRETPPVRLTPTALDAAAVAMSTTLIIGMVGSLVFFLIIAFYRGQYDSRLMYIFGLYSAAIVLVARIAIESGRAYANAFSFPLAAVSILAIMRFVTISGPLGPLSWLVNIGLLAIAWVLADRITFDCTLISDRERSLQQGLLQSLGLLKPDGEIRTPSVIANDVAADKTSGVDKAKPRKKRRHNPGVWVLYFALLAFPLFGLGQLAIPDERQRGWAFTFLISYLACALCLLVLTSLVGMRRYLRQRGVAMPADMSMQWLTAGVGSVLFILVLCLVLPLPGRSLGLVGLPAIFQSPDGLTTSRWGRGEEGSDNQSNQDAARAAPEAPENRPAGQPDAPANGPPQADGPGSPQASDRAGDNAPQQGSEKGASENEQSNSPASSQTSSDQDNSNSAKDSQRDAGQSTSDSPKDNGTKEDQAENQSENQASTGNDNANTGDQPGQADQNNQPENNPSDNNQPRQSDQGAETSSSQPTSSAANPVSQFLGQFGSLGELFKWLTIAVLAAIVILYAMTHPSEVAKFWRELCAFIAALFGRRQTQEASSTPSTNKLEQPKLRRPFHSFANPFAVQLAGWTPAQVVEHSFAALEAWAAEHGTPRQEQQTAAEFARQLASAQPPLGPHAANAASMLDQLMFANWKPKPEELKPLAKLWQSLER